MYMRHHRSFRVALFFVSNFMVWGGEREIGNEADKAASNIYFAWEFRSPFLSDLLAHE